MREQYDTKMLEEMVQSVSDRLKAPAREIGAASDRRTREVEAVSGATTAAAEAQARKTVLYAEGRKMFAIMTAVSLVVLAIGFSGWMILSAMPEKAVGLLAPPPVRTTPAVAPNWPNVTPPAADEGGAGVITTNFTLFREKTVMIGKREYEVVAGHKFASEEDTTFSIAWCYTDAIVDDLSIKVRLGNLDPGASPVVSMPTVATRTKSGLSRADIKTLFNSCPWLDGNPNVQASTARAGAYSFTAEVTEESVDQLIAAISGGVSVVEFSSPGGLVGEALRGFTALRNAGVKTVATGECVSACTLLFLGGTERSVALNGAIGVHQWRTEDGTSSDYDAQMTSALLLGMITSAGVSEEFYIAGARTPASGMYFLTRAELVNWGVVGRTS